MTGARFRDGVWEGKCDACLEWMPLDTGHWYPRHGVRRCIFCLNTAQAERQKARRGADPAYREGCNEAQRAKRHANRDAFLEYQRRWYRANRDAILTKKRAEYAEKVKNLGELDALRAKNREWMRQWRARKRLNVEGLGTSFVEKPLFSPET